MLIGGIVSEEEDIMEDDVNGRLVDDWQVATINADNWQLPWHCQNNWYGNYNWKVAFFKEFY